nr:immunoglobulin heavy chain junction region [Mus musculus]MBK4187339.1 immunoglobulin heavy chain junction region [Mus musculus]MBK4187340.1 immunoglobulin heavy chain junction region [Mus musculus]MBK4187341.1 immunoglobulin heavy chain junction region [Mus musculus]MBK4187342.1 immunoglobulin heavy chain junction region [Mus musculus]
CARTYDYDDSAWFAYW